MNYEAVAEAIKADYREITERYRCDDEIEVRTENHRRLSATLRRICDSFPHPISALDVGCGTGRFFHSLTNVRDLIGIDLTEEMLRAAENPVLEGEISVEHRRLVCANIYLLDFPPESFHFIYSLGMFGNGCPVTTELCDRFYRWLVPGGKLFFDTVDLAGQPLWHRARMQAKELLYPVLSQRWRAVLDEREARHPFFGLTKGRLDDILQESDFQQHQITSHACDSPLWDGRHLECLALKAA